MRLKTKGLDETNLSYSAGVGIAIHNTQDVITVAENNRRDIVRNIVI